MIPQRMEILFPYFKTVDSITYYAEYSTGTKFKLLIERLLNKYHTRNRFTATPTQPKCFGEKDP
jgi:hypothetical protein